MTASSQRIQWTVLRAGALFTISAITGFLTAFLSQASSPDYQRLFWSVLPLFCLHLVTALIYFVLVRHWSRWIICIVAAIAVSGFSECALRVFNR
jgi:hypothetical protein